MNSDKAHSEPNLDEILPEKTPPNYSIMRSKRRREEEADLDLCEFKEEIRVMIEALMEDQKKELMKINPTLIEIQHTNRNIENSISFLSSQNEELKKKIVQLEEQAKCDREQITLLEGKIEDVQRGNRKTAIEIKNVPKIKKETTEDLAGMVMNLTKTVDCQFSKSDIRDIYRIKSKKEGTNSPIIVETSSTILKTEILKASKAFNVKNKEKLCAKHLGIKENPDSPIYISEQLTAKGARLHFLARDLAKSKIYKFCWTSFGKVYVKKNETSPAIPITSKAQVHKLLQEI